MGATTWFLERINELKAMALAGKSAREIACDLSISRNAVISKINREGIEWSRSGLSKVPGPRDGKRIRARKPRPPNSSATRPARPRVLAPWIAGPGKPTPPVATELPAEPVRGTNVTLMELTTSTCRWPIGTPAEFFCGGQIEHGRVYCPHHCRMAYVKPRWAFKYEGSHGFI
jgi:GcrA cell cycle regulator